MRIDKRKQRSVFMKQIRGEEQRIIEYSQVVMSRMKHKEGGKVVIKPSKDLRKMSYRQLLNRKNYLERIDDTEIERRIKGRTVKEYIDIIQKWIDKWATEPRETMLNSEVDKMREWRNKELNKFIDLGLDKQLNEFYIDLKLDERENRMLSVTWLKMINKMVKEK